MKYLIDTHVCLWAVAEKEKLSDKVKSILEDNSAEILVSEISLFEISIKHQIGKLPQFDVTLNDFVATLNNTGFTLLPLKTDHLIQYFNCTFFSNNHRDPFDRLLISVAGYEEAIFITKDEKFNYYTNNLSIIW